MMKTILEARNINKTYAQDKNNNIQVLQDVSLQVERGEFVAIMGPSGSGKTTLLYAISGMDRPTSGLVQLDEEELTTLSEDELAALRLSRMGFIFQQSNLLKNLCILDNIVLPGYKANKESQDVICSRGEELLMQTGISNIAKNSITQASGGQLQRAAICRALINKPDILFGDEPTGALNSSATAEVLDILASINATGTTVVLVTHDAKVAARADRVLFMMDGHIAGEYPQEKYDPEKQDWKAREEVLSVWLSKMGF
ncbi:putative ABC transport system ATP-binding protein [Lachnospiraceae bacterium PF1-21]|uniref:ABC transporter ATP-binding protein n=1 Tax=Ohessyouella blattaphilus TaxID=2949333 RepID=UPI003E1865E5